MSYLPSIIIPINLFPISIPPKPVSASLLPIPSHPGYEISLAGEVHNQATGRIMATWLQRSSTRWYICCRIGRVHRLLLSAILGRELTADEHARHLNGNTFDNVPVDLAIGSARQNAVDRLRTGTYGRTLTSQQVREIRALVDKFSVAQLAVQYRVSPAHIRRVINRRSWAALI